MNLHAVVAGAISAVNPPQLASVQFSTGVSTTLADGTEVPGYSSPVALSAQVQALQFRDLQQIEGLNLQGTRRAIYFFGDVEGIVRFSGQGGDLVTFPNAVAGFPPGTVWLTAMTLETWPGWCKVAATLQSGD